MAAETHWCDAFFSCRLQMMQVPAAYEFSCDWSDYCSIYTSFHTPNMHRVCLPYVFSYAQSAHSFMKRSWHILHKHDLCHSWISLFRDDVPPLPSAISPFVPSPAALSGHEFHHWTTLTMKKMMMKKTKMYCRKSSAISLCSDPESPAAHHNTGCHLYCCRPCKTPLARVIAII